MTNTELKELIEDCCNEIANKIEPLANVKSRLYESLKPAINYTRCCTELRENNKPVDGGTSYATLGKTKGKSDM